MTIEAYSYPYIIAGVLNSIVLLSFVILLLRNFFKKRTIGTFLLIMTYTFLLGNEILALTAFILEGVNPARFGIAGSVMQLIGVYLLMYTINWMYFFANRHLLRDNDLFKSLYTSILSGLVGITGALSIYDAIAGTGDFWLAKIELTGVDFNIYYPPINGFRIMLTILLFLVGTFTYIRIMWRTFNLQRKAKDIVTKKGFRVVTVSVLLLLLTGLVLGSYMLGANRIALVSALLYIVRGFIVIGAVVTGYIGWLMPDWVRRRFRGKAWITKVYTGKTSAPPAHQANIPKSADSSRMIEISEE
ncbi:MAG: hypothetical protein FK733_02650 [Asgard group archaeon]|nr:hypothetical protein [Asgard group archaeon]